MVGGRTGTEWDVRWRLKMAEDFGVGTVGRNEGGNRLNDRDRRLTFEAVRIRGGWLGRLGFLIAI